MFIFWLEFLKTHISSIEKQFPPNWVIGIKDGPPRNKLSGSRRPGGEARRAAKGLHKIARSELQRASFRAAYSAHLNSHDCFRKLHLFMYRKL